MSLIAITLSFENGETHRIEVPLGFADVERNSEAELGLEVNRAMMQRDGDRLLRGVAAFLASTGTSCSDGALLSLFRAARSAPIRARADLP